MIAEFIKTQDPRWSRLLSNTRHDFYHVPEYVEIAAAHEGGEATAFYAEEGGNAFLAPLLLREIPTDLGVSDCWRDAITPYGYPSPLLAGSHDASLLSQFLSAFKASAFEHNVVTAFFRLNPLLLLPAEALKEYGTLLLHGHTVYIDLSQSQEEIWLQFSGMHRKHINRLIRLGFHTAIDDWSLFDRFIALYGETMERVCAEKSYLFSENYFHNLRRALGERVHLVSTISPDGDVACGGLMVESGGILQYHLAGGDAEFRHLSPGKLTIHDAWRWAKEQGCDKFHIGGGVGGSNDSLFSFKAGFSDERADFYTYRMILNESVYKHLVEAHRARFSRSCDLDTLFFPGYRAPYESLSYDAPRLKEMRSL